MDEQEFNPYAPPKADVTPPPWREAGEWLDAPDAVPAAHGPRWFVDAWLLVQDLPITWFLALLPVFLLVNCSDLMPPPSFDPNGYFARHLEHFFALYIAGPFVAALLLGATFSGSAAMMAHRQTEGDHIRASDIFRFRGRFLQLLLLAFLDACLTVALIAALFLLKPLTGLDPLETREGLLILCVLSIPLDLARIFAPSLDALAGENAFSALVKGLWAALKNWKALLTNGVVPLLLVNEYLYYLADHPDLGFTTSPYAFALLRAISWGGGMFSLILSYVITRDVFYVAEEE